MKMLLLVVLLFGFYVDVTARDYGNRSGSTEAGSQSESNYGYQKGRGI